MRQVAARVPAEERFGRQFAVFLIQRVLGPRNFISAIMPIATWTSHFRTKLHDCELRSKYGAHDSVAPVLSRSTISGKIFAYPKTNFNSHDGVVRSAR